jgi:hypothetical protein
VDIVPKKHPSTGAYQKFIHSFQGSPEAFDWGLTPIWQKSHSGVGKPSAAVGFNWP